MPRLLRISVAKAAHSGLQAVAAWLALLKVGDYLIALAMLLLSVWLAQMSWQHEGAARVRVYQNGRLQGEYDLSVPRKISAQGPLGDTLIEIADGRVRIAKDPSPRQYCVKSGWLSSAGQVAICLPNRTSIELIGRTPPAYDSLSF